VPLVGGYYKQVIALYRNLGVEFRTANFTYSFSSLKQWLNNVVELQTYLIYNGASGTKGVSPPAKQNSTKLGDDVITQLLSFLAFALATAVLLFNYLRLVSLSSPLTRPSPSLTFREWTTQKVPSHFLARWLRLDKSWIAFTEGVLVPIFSAVCTAPEEDIYEHPMEEFLGM